MVWWGRANEQVREGKQRNTTAMIAVEGWKSETRFHCTPLNVRSVIPPRAPLGSVGNTSRFTDRQNIDCPRFFFYFRGHTLAKLGSSGELRYPYGWSPSATKWLLSRENPALINPACRAPFERQWVKVWGLRKATHKCFCLFLDLLRLMRDGASLLFWWFCSVGENFVHWKALACTLINPHYWAAKKKAVHCVGKVILGVFLGFGFVCLITW